MKYSVLYRLPGDPATKQAVMECLGEDSLRARCNSMGWEVLYTEIVSDKKPFLERLTGKIRLRMIRFGVSTAELCMFCEVMRSLHEASVPMLQILEMCIAEQGNKWFRKRLEIVLERIQGGANLSTAMEDPRCVKAFPKLMRETVRIGQTNGKLGEALSRLVATFTRAVETRRETITAMIYPTIVMIVLFVVCAVIATMVPPVIEELVGKKEIGKLLSQLPASMRLLFYVYNHKICLIYPPLSLAGLIVLWRLGMKYHATRFALTKLQRRVWLIGSLLYQFALVRFLDMLVANYETGILISESLQLIQGTVDDVIIEDSLGRINEQIVSKGLKLSDAISQPKEEDVYPTLVRQMIRAGEQSGKLAETLRPMVAYYENQAKAMLKRTMSMMEPLTIILIGAIIGPVVFGLYKTLTLLSDAAAR